MANRQPDRPPLPPGLAAALAGQAAPVGPPPVLEMTEHAGLAAVACARRPDGMAMIEFIFVNGTGWRVLVGDWGSWQEFRKAVDGLKWVEANGGEEAPGG